MTKFIQSADNKITISLGTATEAGQEYHIDGWINLQ